jgi:S-adenosylmethionine:tRNA ribosyltransferase-isomerase
VGILDVNKVGTIDGDFLVHLKWNLENLSLAQVLNAAGFVPLPPYIKRAASKEDEEQYQTIYAVREGSVAAPTAGLHFSEKVFESIKQKNIQSLFSTLHVSAGTFLPVKSKTMEGHAMHQEQIVIRKEMVEKLLTAKMNKSSIIVVGTTSLRTIESLFWLGKKLLEGNEDLKVDQWEPYETDDSPTHHSPLITHQSLNVILDWMKKNDTNQFIVETKILIAPGYNFKLVDGLITNFHLPQSTLLLLVAALIEDDWRKVYDYALHHDFRFLSYGDASLLWRKK